eukprot:2579163-Amphidinium_carterae.1
MATDVFGSCMVVFCSGLHKHQIPELPARIGLFPVAAMGRMYGKGKGMADTACPYRRRAPTWLKIKPEDWLG